MASPLSNQASAVHPAVIVTMGTVEDLPNELLLQVTGYLSLRSLIHLRNVDTRWRAIVAAAADAGLPKTTGNLLKAWIVGTSSPFPDSTQLSSSISTLKRGLSVTSASSPSLSSVECSGSITTGKPLTNAERDNYVCAVGRYARSFQAVSHEEPGLSDEFLTWLFEWPAHAGLFFSIQMDLNMGGYRKPPRPHAFGPRRLNTQISSSLSPYTVISSLTNSASYHGSNGGSDGIPWYYYQERVIFMLVLEDNDVLLPRIQLAEDPGSPVAASTESTPASKVDESGGKGNTKSAPRSTRLKCSLLSQSPSPLGFGGDWARFLPISTVQRTRSQRGSPGSSTSTSTSPGSADINVDSVQGSDGDPYSADADAFRERAPLPLYVLSGSGIGERMAGSVCTLGPNAVLRVEANSWSEWLMQLATAAAKERNHTCLPELPIPCGATTGMVGKSEDAPSKVSSKKLHEPSNISSQTSPSGEARVESEDASHETVPIPTSHEPQPSEPGEVAGTSRLWDFLVVMSVPLSLVTLSVLLGSCFDSGNATTCTAAGGAALYLALK